MANFFEIKLEGHLDPIIQITLESLRNGQRVRFCGSVVLARDAGKRGRIMGLFTVPAETMSQQADSTLNAFFTERLVNGLKITPEENGVRVRGSILFGNRKNFNVLLPFPATT